MRFPRLSKEDSPRPGEKVCAFIPNPACGARSGRSAFGSSVGIAANPH